MNWQDYEKEIYNYFKSNYNNIKISKNVYVEGRFSKVKREIDLLIENYIAGNRIKIAFDGKYFSRKINVKEVESFIGMLSDLDVHKGIMITKKGYSDAAMYRAYYDYNDIELDILNFDKLKEYQIQGAIPYAGNYGFLLNAPFGWVIDFRKSDSWLVVLYQRGKSFEEANQNGEFIYINYWDKNIEPKYNMEELLSNQEKNIKGSYETPNIKYLPTINREDGNTKLREVSIDEELFELTGFIDFGDIIFFAVLLTPKVCKNRNLKKLEYVLKTIKLANIKFKDEES